MEADQQHSDEDDADSDFEEVAFTLAIIANTDTLYNEVHDAWRANIENEQRISRQRLDMRQINQRVVIDELPRPSHELCPGFNFSSTDEASGRSITSAIGISTATEARNQH